MKKVELAVDFGGSGLKPIASHGDRVIAFRIAPQIIDISDPKYASKEFSIDLTKILWVGYPNACYALGEFAATQYHAPVPLVEPKKTYIIPRTLGAVAVAAHRFGIKKFKLNLQLLLPAAEFSKDDKQELKDELTSALTNFQTPIGDLEVELFNFTAKPEGFGLMRRRMVLLGADYQRQNTAVVMFGHRNTSLYLSSGGEQRHYRSNNTGFIRAIEAANVDQVKAIANPELVDKESVMGYWKANKIWLRENWPDSATTAIVGGGPIAMIGGSVAKYLDELMGIEQSPHKTLTFLDGGMPLSKYEEVNCTPEKDPSLPLLTSWPKGIGISDDEKRQFADVYCLWATNQIAKKA